MRDEIVRERDSARLAEASARERVRVLEDAFRRIPECASALDLQEPNFFNHVDVVFRLAGRDVRREADGLFRALHAALSTEPPARISEVPEHHNDGGPDDGDEADPIRSGWGLGGSDR